MNLADDRISKINGQWQGDRFTYPKTLVFHGHHNSFGNKMLRELLNLNKHAKHSVHSIGIRFAPSISNEFTELIECQRLCCCFKVDRPFDSVDQMKLAIAFMTVGLVFVTWISNVNAGSFSAGDTNHHESNRIPAVWRSPIDSHAMDLAPDLTDGNGRFESDCNRIVASHVQQKAPLDRVDLLIKRSHHGIQITISHSSDNVTNPDHQNCVKPRSGQFECPSRICSHARDSVERRSLELSDPSVTADFDRSKHDELFNVKFTHVPGPTSLAISIVDLIGVVIGCYCQRRSNAV